MRTALYLRVSTDDQTTENQERELRMVCDRNQWDIVNVYLDHGVSGSHGRDKRPQFDAFWKACTRREVDRVAAWDISRVGRSLKDVVTFLDEMNALKVGVYLHQQAIDTATPAGLAMVQMAGVFAQFERSMARERSMAGQARAKAQGIHCGRPHLALELQNKVKRALERGEMGQVAIRQSVRRGVPAKHQLHEFL
jgi:DNA invertase Pin-like site-specific DNA recombinase